MDTFFILMEEGNLDNPDLNDLVEMVIRSNRKVIILPKERMPSETGVAAFDSF